MNPNEQSFFDLAMKVIAGQATPAEQTELTALTSRDAALKAELEQLRMDVALAREVVPLLAATETSDRKMPGYGRERLQTKVRQTLGVPKRETGRSGMWRWWLGVATAAAVVVLVVIKLASPGLPPLIQVAMLDSVGGTRGTGEKSLEVLQRQWQDSKPQEFDDAAKLKHWQDEWPETKQPVAKILYDRDALEVRVTLRAAGKVKYEHVYKIQTNEELPAILVAANEAVMQHRKH